MLRAAAEVSQRGLAHIILLGEGDKVRAEAAKLGLDISPCTIVNPQVLIPSQLRRAVWSQDLPEGTVRSKALEGGSLVQRS